MNEFHLISSNAHGANYAKQEKIKLKNLISYELNEDEKIYCSTFSFFSAYHESEFKNEFWLKPGMYSYLEVEKKDAKITTTLLCTSSAHYQENENINENIERNQNLYIKPEIIKDLFALINSESQYLIDKNIDKNFYLSKHQATFNCADKIKVNFSYFNGGEKHINHFSGTEYCIPSFFTDLSFQTIERPETIVKVSPKNNVINKNTELTSSHHIVDFFTSAPSNINYQKMELWVGHNSRVFLSEIRDHEMPEKIFINKNVYVEKTNSFIPILDQIGREHKNFSINFKISSNKKMTSFLCLNISSKNSNHVDNIGQVTLENHILEIKGGCKINLKKLATKEIISTITEFKKPKDVSIDFSIKTISKEFIPLKETVCEKLLSSKTSENDSISANTSIPLKDVVNKLFPSIDYAPNFKNNNNGNYDGNINDDIFDASHENVAQNLGGENSSICVLI